MGNWFKWNMFFTSFLPLWVSIIISDLWSITVKIHNLLTTITEEAPVSVKSVLCSISIEMIMILLLSICSVVSIYAINDTIKTQQSAEHPEHGTIKRAKRANKLTAEFLLAYILPMIAFDFSEIKSILLFLIYFAVLTFLCIRNNNVYTNIFLEFKGYRMYECDIECPNMNGSQTYIDSLIISKNNLTQAIPQEIHYFDFDNYIYIEI
ncbi:hypothetical protein [Desulfosporosinus burensis]